MPANVVVPEVGESIVDARVSKWLKKEGDAVNVGDPLVELETDKIDLEVAAPQAGVLGRIAHADGADVKVGEVLAVIDDAGAAPQAAGGTPQAGSAAASGIAAVDEGKQAKQRATPAARNVAQRNDVDLQNVQGSGDAGRVMRRDVEATTSALRGAPEGAAAAAAPAPPKPQARPLTPVREERRQP